MRVSVFTSIVAALLCSSVAGCGAGPRAVREQQAREREAALAAQAQENEPFQVAASHILVSYAGAERAGEQITRTREEARARARQALERVAAGEEFALVAREMSDGPSAQAGGSVGSFSRAKMAKAFSDAAFSLEPGQVAPEVVETQFGFHVIRRDR